MQILTTVPVRPEAVSPRPDDEHFVKVTRSAYSVDGYSPVIVTIRVLEDFATISTTILPDGRMAWWREPDASARRRLLNAALVGTGRRRVGRVADTTADAWHHRYSLAAALPDTSTR